MEDREEIVDNFYEEMYLKGNICEQSHEIFDTPMDTDNKGTEIQRDFTVQTENRQRAKILSSEYQRQQRKKLIYDNLFEKYTKERLKYEKELDLYRQNGECENKILWNYVVSVLQENDMNQEESIEETIRQKGRSMSYQSISELVNLNHF